MDEHSVRACDVYLLQECGAVVARENKTDRQTSQTGPTDVCVCGYYNNYINRFC